MPKEFLGVGWAFPPGLENGAIEEAAYEESVRQAIKIILGTARGERVMRPDYGCGIHDLVFATPTATTTGRVSLMIQEALLQHEPRIDVQEVQAELVEKGRVLEISISYRVRATNNVFNLVYPFYLERSVT